MKYRIKLGKLFSERNRFKDSKKFHECKRDYNIQKTLILEWLQGNFNLN